MHSLFNNKEKKTVLIWYFVVVNENVILSIITECRNRGAERLSCVSCDIFRIFRMGIADNACDNRKLYQNCTSISM